LGNEAILNISTGSIVSFCKGWFHKCWFGITKQLPAPFFGAGNW